MTKFNAPTVGEQLRENGSISRRAFLKFCGLLASSMALAPSMIPKLAAALEKQAVLR